MQMDIEWLCVHRLRGYGIRAFTLFPIPNVAIEFICCWSLSGDTEKRNYGKLLLGKYDIEYY